MAKQKKNPEDLLKDNLREVIGKERVSAADFIELDAKEDWVLIRAKTSFGNNAWLGDWKVHQDGRVERVDLGSGFVEEAFEDAYGGGTPHSTKTGGVPFWIIVLIVLMGIGFFAVMFFGMMIGGRPF